MKRSRGLLLCLALSACGLLQSTDAQARAFSETQNSFFPIDVFGFVPCAVGGEGELIELTGQLHDLFHVTSDNSGGFHIEFEDNPQDVTGTGQTTGDTYRATGVTEDEAYIKAGFQATFIDNFHIIGPGPENNFLVHDNAHITVNANGEVISFHDNFSIECK